MFLSLDALLVWKSAAVFGWLALLFVLERVWPAALRPQERAGERWGWRRCARNGGLWLANVALSPLAVVPVSAWAAGMAFDWRPPWWSGWLGLAVDVLVLDVLIYGWHRANHRVSFLWRFHEIHHLDRFLDTTSALRFHAGEVVLSALARAAVIVLLAVPVSSVLVFEALVLMAALFHHANLRLPPRLEKALSWVVVTPAIHWVHHHADHADTNSNFATILSIWDRVFASRSATRRTPGMLIGVEGEADQPLTALFARPFRMSHPLTPEKRQA